MSGKPSSTIAFEKRWNGLLQLSRDQFVEQAGTNVPKRPHNMEAILLFNQGRG